MAAVTLTAARRAALAIAVVGLLAGCGARSISGQARPATLPGSFPPASTGPPAGAAQPNGSPSAGGAAQTNPAATTSPAAVPSADGRPCPDSVAAALPGGGPADLIAGYETARFRLYFCRTDDGALYYRGVSRVDPGGAVTVPAYPIADGFEARRTVDGSTFVYQVKARVLRVFQDGTLLRADPVLRDL